MNLLSLVGLRMDNICQIRRKWYYSSGSFLLQTKRGPGRSLFCLHGVPERSSHGRLKADATLSVQAAPQQAGSQVSARQSTKHNNPKLLCIIVALRGRPMKDAADKTYVRATTRVGGPGGERRHRWTRPGTSLSRLILFRIRDCRIWLAHMSVPARHCSCPGPRGGWSHVAFAIESHHGSRIYTSTGSNNMLYGCNHSSKNGPLQHPLQLFRAATELSMFHCRS
jgi:hypothetical protein